MNKQNRKRLIDREQDDSCCWGRLESGEKQKGKSTHGHGQQCGDCGVEEGVKGINGNGKNTIKNKSKKKTQPKQTDFDRSIKEASPEIMTVKV